MHAELLLSDQKLLPGYAMASTRRHPREPETVIVCESDCRDARCVGSAMIDGSLAWLAFKLRGKRQYFFQHRPW